MNRLAAILIALCIIHVCSFAGPAKAYFCRASIGNAVVLENDLVKITIAETGGKVIGWYVKSLRRDIAAWDSTLPYAVLAQRFGVFDDSAKWPGGWPSPIGLEKYQTEILPSADQSARVRQTLIVPPPSAFSGLSVEKTYTLSVNRYELSVDYVITNTSREVKCYLDSGSTYGINLTVETTMLCDTSYTISFKSNGRVYSSPFPAEFFNPDAPNAEFKQAIDWCAIEDKNGGYVMGSFYPSGLTRGLWPGEQRSGAYDYEIIFRSVTYQPGQVETYHFRTCGGPGNIESFARGELSNPTSIERATDEVPGQLRLMQNYPNPFNPSTTIEFSVPANSFISLKVLNLLGQEVAVLVNEEKHAGLYRIQWQADVPSGVYLYRLQSGGHTLLRKMTFIR
ncbi:MAG: T9SS type A sorting domain-containing protein [Ignavibacteriales bacterium]|nr:T9SS type A sorting domain-containing protein [Ignavibacteriales bacterium]